MLHVHMCVLCSMFVCVVCLYMCIRVVRGMVYVCGIWCICVCICMYGMCLCVMVWVVCVLCVLSGVCVCVCGVLECMCMCGVCGHGVLYTILFRI